MEFGAALGLVRSRPRRSPAGNVEYRDRADVEHLLPFLDGVVHRHRVEPGDARAADEHIDVAQRRLRRGGDRFLREATVALGASRILPREKPRAKEQH
jgi:hypothetical protein